MHHRRCHGISTIVHDVNLLNRGITFVHIVEFELILVEQQVLHLIGIIAGIVLQFCHHNTFHREIDGLFGTVALDGSHLMEPAELSGIVGQFDSELIPCPNLLGKLDIRTTAIGFHTLDMQPTMPFVLQLKSGGDSLHIACTPTLDGRFVDSDSLRRST